MQGKKQFQIDVYFLKILISIYDEFENFYKDFLEFLDDDEASRREDIYNLCNPKRISFFKRRKYLDFVSNHKNIFDKIGNNYRACLFLFSLVSCSSNDFSNNSETLEAFNYLKDKRKDFNKIIELLNEIVKLDVDDVITIDSNTDFTTEEYLLSNSIIYSFYDIVLVDNICGLYSSDNLYDKYTTTGSDYKIIMPSVGKNKLILKNLIFDKNRLPKELNRDEIYCRIKNVINSKKTESLKVRNAVLVCVTVDDLRNQFESTKNIISNVMDEKVKEQLLEKLEKIYYILNDLTNIVEDNNEFLTSEISGLTTLEIHNAANVYIRRREDAKYDWD